MVKITVDTAKDSPEDIRKAIQFLDGFLTEAENREADVHMGMFDSGKNKDKEEDKEAFSVLEY